MSADLFLSLLLVLWIAFQLGSRSSFVRRRARLFRLRFNLLAFPSSSPSPDENGDDDEPRWSVSTTPIGVQVSTTTLNELPRHLLGLLGKEQRRWLARVYDVGIIWGAVGMASTVGILLWEGATFVIWILRVTGSSGVDEGVVRVARRAMEEGTSGEGGRMGEGIIRPLVRRCSLSLKVNLTYPTCLPDPRDHPSPVSSLLPDPLVPCRPTRSRTGTRRCRRPVRLAASP